MCRLYNTFHPAYSHLNMKDDGQGRGEGGGREAASQHIQWRSALIMMILSLPRSASWQTSRIGSIEEIWYQQPYNHAQLNTDVRRIRKSVL